MSTQSGFPFACRPLLCGGRWPMLGLQDSGVSSALSHIVRNKRTIRVRIPQDARFADNT